MFHMFIVRVNVQNHAKPWVCSAGEEIILDYTHAIPHGVHSGQLCVGLLGVVAGRHWQGLIAP